MFLEERNRRMEFDAFQKDRVPIFISYSHKDKRHLERLRTHLADLERTGRVILWSDKEIAPGSDWRQEIKRAIEAAQIAVLLVSADFLASQFIAEDELPPLLNAAATKGTLILPVILSPCGFQHSRLSRFQAANDPSKPLIGLNGRQREALWDRVANTIRDTIVSLPLVDDAVIEEDTENFQKYQGPFHVSYGQVPSQATVKTDDQFIVLQSRAGAIEGYMLNIAKEVLYDLKNAQKLIKRNSEFLMFRGAWFDDKHGGVSLYIDLIHDNSVQPSLTADDIKAIFYDGIAWYEYQGIDVTPRVMKANTGSDGFFPNSSEYYDGFPWF